MAMRGVRSLTPLAISLVVLTMVISVGGIMLAQFGNVDVVTNSTTADSIITQGQNALETFGSFFTVIVVVGIGAVLLLLLQVFRSAGMGGGGQSMA